MRLSTEELAYYLAVKNSLISEYKGRSYSHAANIAKNLVYFSDKESLFSRMITYSPSLIKSLIQNQILVQAPLIDKKLVFVHKELLPFFYYFYCETRDVGISHIATEILNTIQQEKKIGITRLQHLYELSKKDLMSILSELRKRLKIIMYYDGNEWNIAAPEPMLLDNKISTTKAQLELVFQVIKSYGPITAPQITRILRMPSSKVSNSLIELYASRKIKRGHFIEDSAYESFIAADETEKLGKIVKDASNKKEIVYLPSSDPLIQYWSSADFTLLDDYLKGTILLSGYPVLSFDYVKKGEKLHITEIRQNLKYEGVKKDVLKKLKEFAENQNRILIFPQTKSASQLQQAQNIVQIMKKRGYVLDGEELMFRLLFTRTVKQEAELLTLEEALPILLELQSLSLKTRLGKEVEILNLLEQYGMPLPLSALYSRIVQGKERLLISLFQQKKILIGKFGPFERGIISTNDYDLYTKITPKRPLGMLEERVLRILKKEGKSNFKELKESLSLSDHTLQSALNKLEEAKFAVRIIDKNYRYAWYYHEDFFSKEPKAYSNQKEAWLELLLRTLKTNLPLTVTQLVTLMGMSYNQIERYIKELIATANIRYGTFIEGEKERQLTTEEIEQILKGYSMEDKEKRRAKKRDATAYLAYNEPILKSNLTKLIRRFSKKQVFLRTLPDYYGELIILNGIPAAAIYFRRTKGLTHISDLEVVAEHRKDINAWVIILELIKEQMKKKRGGKEGEIVIKNVNGLPITARENKEVRELIRNLY